VEEGAEVLAVMPERAPLEDVYLTLIDAGAEGGGD
jgi:hypothetical protein